MKQILNSKGLFSVMNAHRSVIWFVKELVRADGRSQTQFEMLSWAVGVGKARVCNQVSLGFYWITFVCRINEGKFLLSIYNLEKVEKVKED